MKSTARRYCLMLRIFVVFSRIQSSTKRICSLYYLVVAASESFQAEGGNVGVLTNPEVLKAACVIFATVPIIIVYPFLQKYFVQGTMVGAVKE